MRQLKREPVPPGLVSSLLLRNSKTPESYRIQTIWENRDALSKMRSSTKTPKAIELFQRNGVQPTLEIFEFLDSAPLKFSELMLTVALTRVTTNIILN